MEPGPRVRQQGLWAVARARAWHPSRALLTAFAPVIILLVISIVIGLANPRFFTYRNFELVLKQSATLLVLAMGETFVILAGGIDLSVEGIMAISSVTVSMLVKNIRNGNDLGLLGVLIAVGVGGLFGLMNGVTHTRLRIPSFMATFGMGAVGTGLAVIVYGGYPIRILDPLLRSWATDNPVGVPRIAILALAVFLIALFIERQTRLGRYAFVLGGGEELAKQSGIDVDRYKVLIYTLAGFFFGLGGVFHSCRIGVGTAIVGLGTGLNTIAVVVIGGTALTGGVGSVARTVVGVLIITVLTNGMLLVGINPYIQQAIIGLGTIGAVAATIDRSKIRIIK